MRNIHAHIYEVRPRKDKRGVDLISDALPIGRLWLRRAKRGQQRNRLCAIYFARLVWDFRVCSPYRHRRDCGTSKPGKKKQKRYDYGCAILNLHCNHLSCWLIRIRAKGFKVEKKGRDSRYIALISKRLCRDSFPEICNLVARNKLSVWIQIEAALAHFLELSCFSFEHTLEIARE